MRWTGRYPYHQKLRRSEKREGSERRDFSLITVPVSLLSVCRPGCSSRFKKISFGPVNIISPSMNANVSECVSANCCNLGVQSVIQPVLICKLLLEMLICAPCKVFSALFTKEWTNEGSPIMKNLFSRIQVKNQKIKREEDHRLTIGHAI